jgi:phospholipid transport system substrate-binding protein
MRRFLSVLVLAASMALAGSALADTPDNFVKTGTQTLTNLLKQPASPARDAAITKEFDLLVDYAELAKRCFRDDWGKLTPVQQAEVTGLIHQLVEKNYRKNLTRTLEYTIKYSGQGAQGTDTRVRTEATNTTNARDTVQIDYIVAGTGAGPFKIVDIVTEGSSLTQSYFNQFTKMLSTPGQGYPYIVQKINEKLAKP